MIFGNTHDLRDYAFLEPTVLECFRYAAKHDLTALAPGRHPIDGDRLLVNIAEYETTDAQNRVWEAHRQYLDLHLMLRGREQIDLNFTQNMAPQPYVEAEDFLPLSGEPNSHVILTGGDFLLCYPADAHRTAVRVREAEPVRKAIFKIKIR